MKVYRIVATVILLVMVGLGAVAQMGESANTSQAPAPAGNWNASDMQGLKIN